MSLPSQAGTAEGNGGSGLICGNRVYARDIWEGLNDPTFTQNGQQARYPRLRTRDEYLNRFLRRVEAIHPIYGALARAELKKIKAQLTPSGSPLRLQDDFTTAIEARGCRRVQLVTYIEAANGEPAHVIYQRDLMRRMDPLNQAAIYAHEAIYKIDRKIYHQDNSDRTRRIVARGMSENLGNDLQSLMRGDEYGLAYALNLNLHSIGNQGANEFFESIPTREGNGVQLGARPTFSGGWQRVNPQEVFVETVRPFYPGTMPARIADAIDYRLMYGSIVFPGAGTEPVRYGIHGIYPFPVRETGIQANDCVASGYDQHPYDASRLYDRDFQGGCAHRESPEDRRDCMGVALPQKMVNVVGCNHRSEVIASEDSMRLLRYSDLHWLEWKYEHNIHWVFDSHRTIHQIVVDPARVHDELSCKALNDRFMMCKLEHLKNVSTLNVAEFPGLENLHEVDYLIYRKVW